MPVAKKPAKARKGFKSRTASRTRSSAGGLRGRLIAAGLSLVERSGAGALSLREVTRRSGVSHMAPYSHFRNKSELLCAVAIAGFQRFREHLAQAAMSGGTSPREQLRRIGVAYIGFAFEHPQLLGLMFGGLIPVREQARELQAARDCAFTDLTAVVAAAIECGEFKAGDARRAAFAAWSIVHGFSQLALCRELHDKLGVTDDAILDNAAVVIDRLIDGLDAGKSTVS
jgi:AcrR family transcriptional regulator